MIGVEAERSANISAEDVKQAEIDRRMDAATLGFSISQERVPVDRGQLQQTGFQPEKRGDSIVFGYTAPYAEPMEKGTQAYWPPAQPLVEWAQRIGKDASFGYAVQHKIAREGISPQPYLEPAADRMKTWLDSHSLEEYMDE